MPIGLHTARWSLDKLNCVLVQFRLTYCFDGNIIAHRCRSSYSHAGSIAKTAFLQTSMFCAASFGSSWCSFISLRSLSIHLSRGLPLGPSSSFLPLQHSCRLFSLHGHTTKGVSWWLDHCIAPELFVSDSVFPSFALNPYLHFDRGRVHPILLSFVQCLILTAIIPHGGNSVKYSFTVL